MDTVKLNEAIDIIKSLDLTNDEKTTCIGANNYDISLKITSINELGGKESVTKYLKENILKSPPTVQVQGEQIGQDDMLQKIYTELISLKQSKKRKSIPISDFEDSHIESLKESCGLTGQSYKELPYSGKKQNMKTYIWKYPTTDKKQNTTKPKKDNPTGNFSKAITCLSTIFSPTLNIPETLIKNEIIAPNDEENTPKKHEENKGEQVENKEGEKNDNNDISANPNKKPKTSTPTTTATTPTTTTKQHSFNSQIDLWGDIANLDDIPLDNESEKRMIMDYKTKFLIENILVPLFKDNS
ncbi:pleckstrin (PH) domain-containing protein [Tieghemostelium lacteum]|uniref:Pleckstrin (PH) domain-containing protein n=1 Tax=Tieghemostelium lacteum TaxID=361077 RepID=A0A152A4I2_TIELA|nr:pleckstrin (PH) domain-containing protein [Tieghemostelium lacteum]|eukprot:KYR00985.1 pleckstrin (PH) domain-containing protein [Tieghemostelium lacteum]